MNAIGKPMTRAEGPLKVTGAAKYTGDLALTNLAHGFLVHSRIANGRVVSIDTSEAEKAQGVVAVLTSRNMPRLQPTPKPWVHLHPHGQGYLPLQDDNIHYAGQPVALVIANSRDQAEYAGTLLRIKYEEQTPAVFNADTAKNAIDPPQFLWPVNSSVGDPEKGLADGAVKIQQVYSTPDRHHNQMEPHVTVANWGTDDTLTLFDATQFVIGTRDLVAIVLGIPPATINVVSKLLGGGFGGKAYVWPHTILAAVAAKQVRRPVRLELARAQMYSMVGHQPATIQNIAIAADPAGKLTGIRHESITPTSVFDNYIEYAANVTRFLWPASGGIATVHKTLAVNRNTPTAMRSPHEALGHFALESAMDELAYATGIDPVQLRLLNDTDTDPFSKRPFSTRGIRRCLVEGGERFGWARRNPKPRSMHDGRHLIGQGVASAIYTHWRWPAKASVTIKANGTAVVEAATHELGQGTYTVMRQVAADAMGLPAEKISVVLGDTHLPESHASIGSATMANAGAAIMLAAQAARDKAIELAMKGKFSPLSGAKPGEISAEGGVLKQKNGGPQVSYVDLLAKNGIPSLQAHGDYNPIDEYKGPKAIFSFSSVFAEVRVDEDLGLVRLNRLVGAYDAGKIINPTTARSQAIGGIIWGTGQALLEQSETDPRTGSYLHRNLSGYLVPSNADIPHLDILFCEEFDEEASPLGAKGLGELTAVSVSAAIANAVYHATGKRIRELPITIEKMMA